MLSAPSLSAQAETELPDMDPGYSLYDRFLVDLSFDIANPTGTFGDLQRNTGFGYSSDFFLRVGDGPLFLGLGYHFMQYSQEVENYTELIDGESIPFSIRTNNNAHAIQFGPRIQPRVKFPIQPYAQGFFRAQRFFTLPRIRDEDLNEVQESSVNEQDYSFAYGATGGLIIPLGNEVVMLHLKATFIQGNASTYYVRLDQPDNPTDPIDYFEPVRSVTNRWVYGIGLHFPIW